MIAKKLKKNLDQAYEDVGFKLQEEFGSLFKAFEHATKGPGLLKDKGVKDPWLKEIVAMAAKLKVEKIHEMVGEFNLVCYQADGVKVIKKVLGIAEKDPEISVSYISAPKYRIVGRGKDKKQLEQMLEDSAKAVIKELEQNNGEGSFTLKK